MLVSVGDTGFEPVTPRTYDLSRSPTMGVVHTIPNARMLCIHHAQRRSRMYDPDEEVEDNKEELRSLEEEDA